MKLQPRCQPGLQSYEGLPELEDPLPSSALGCWQEASVPHQMCLSIILLMKWEPASPRANDERERERTHTPRWKLQCLLWPHLRSDTTSLLLCSVSHEDQPWYNLGGNDTSVWILGSRAHRGTSWNLATTLPLYSLLPSPSPIALLIFQLQLLSSY